MDDSCIANLNSTPCVAAHEPMVFAPSAEFLSSLVGCLTDLFSLPLYKESPSKTSSFINNAFQKHFGVTLTSTSMNSIIPNSSPLDTVQILETAPNVSVPSPSSDAVCSNDEDLGSFLSVDGNFKLVSDSDMSGEDGVGGEWVPVFPGKRGGRRRGGMKSQTVQSLPIPSPVLGHGKKTHKDKKILATVNSTSGIGRPNTRQRSQK